MQSLTKQSNREFGKDPDVIYPVYSQAMELATTKIVIIISRFKSGLYTFREIMLLMAINHIGTWGTALSWL